MSLANHADSRQPLPLPATESCVDLKLWQQVDALRALLQHGSRLLGEVVVLTRDAEEAVSRIAAERELLAEQRRSLEEERTCAHIAAEKALAQMEAQQRELSSLRVGMETLRQSAASAALEASSSAQLADLEQRLRTTEHELTLTRQLLNEERERRNRAILLIRPQPPGVRPAPAAGAAAA